MSVRRLLGLAASMSVLSGCSESVTEPRPLESAQLARVGNSSDCWVIGDVSGNDPGRAEGSKRNPYGSLAAVQAATNCKNIGVLHSAIPLDGGITLREGQKIRGNPDPGGALPMITNSTYDTNDGRGIVLADKTTVSGLHVLNTRESGIYGHDVDGVEIWDNELSGFNTDSNIHPRYLQIGNFRMYFGGIHVEGTDPGRSLNVSIRDNYLHDAQGVGVNIMALGESAMNVDMRRNTLVRLGQRPDNPDPFPSDRPQPIPFSAIGNVAINVFSFDQATMRLRLDDTVIEDHGPLVGTTSRFIEFDALSIWAGGSATLVAVVDRLTFSDNGVVPHGNIGTQVVQAGVDADAVGAVFDLTIKNSHFKDPITTHLALTSYYNMRDVSIRYVIENTVMEGTRAPFAPAVTVQHGGFSFLGGPSLGTRLSVEFTDNTVIQRSTSEGDGMNFFNFAGAIRQLDITVEGNSFDGMGSMGRGLRFTESGTTTSSAIDAGGGSLRSRGQNSIVGFGVDIEASGYAVTAKHNWWGSAAGPSTVVGPVDVVPFLTEAPRR